VELNKVKSWTQERHGDLDAEWSSRLKHSRVREEIEKFHLFQKVLDEARPTLKSGREEASVKKFVDSMNDTDSCKEDS
jgi:hypothetical protein